MKKSIFLAFISLSGILLLSFGTHADDTAIKTYEGKGEVVAVSPLFSRITIKHELIKNFSEATETEFPVTSKTLIEKVQKGDLVRFRISDNRGDVVIDQIVKIGIAPKIEEGSAVGHAVHNVLVGTSQVVNGVTQPVEPANRLANSVMGAATDSTEEPLKDAPEAKRAF